MGIDNAEHKYKMPYWEGRPSETAILQLWYSVEGWYTCLWKTVGLGRVGDKFGIKVSLNDVASMCLTCSNCFKQYVDMVM